VVQQMNLTFEPGLTARFRSLREVTAHSVYSSRRGLSAVAADLDMSPSELTKRLNADSAEPRPMRVDDLEAIIQSTGDATPIYWLVEKYLRDPDAVRNQATAQIAALLPALLELAKQAGLGDNVAPLQARRA
jgi:hypothetical protein